MEVDARDELARERQAAILLMGSPRAISAHFRFSFVWKPVFCPVHTPRGERLHAEAVDLDVERDIGREAELRITRQRFCRLFEAVRTRVVEFDVLDFLAVEVLPVGVGELIQAFWRTARFAYTPCAMSMGFFCAGFNSKCAETVIFASSRPHGSAFRCARCGQVYPAAPRIRRTRGTALRIALR